MDEQTQKILDKIQKLFALARSPNEAEAAAAAAKAHELLKLYNLDLDEVKAKTEDVAQELFSEGSRARQWRLQVLAAVARSNYCGVFIEVRRELDPQTGRLKSVRRVNLVGRSHNLQAAKLMADYLFSAVDRLANLRKKRGPGADESYRMGVADSLCQRLAEIREQELATASQSRDLVLREDRAVQDFFQNRGMKTRTVRSRISNASSYQRGRADGQTISLNSQVED